MKILIIFETVEGQTGKIVDFIRNQLTAADHQVEVFNTEDRLKPMTFEGFDKVVLAAPVHERRHPKAFEVFVSASKTDLNSIPTFMISVSLKASFPEGKDEAQDYLTEMEMRTGFTPDKTLLVAGAVRTESYGYFESQVVKDVVLNGRDIELVDGVREFTDWDELRREIDRFVS